jgi:hypothetical protein
MPTQAVVGSGGGVHNFCCAPSPVRGGIFVAISPSNEIPEPRQRAASWVPIGFVRESQVDYTERDCFWMVGCQKGEPMPPLTGLRMFGGQRVLQRFRP